MILSKPLLVAVSILLLAGCQGDKPGIQPDDAPGYASTASAVSGASCHARHVNEADPEAWEPDPVCTPGKANPAVTVGQLCPVAHTKQWRPSVSVSNQLKRNSLARYDYVDSQGNHPQTMASTEGDHDEALEVGGDPTAPENFWAEPELGHPNEKDHVEDAAHAALCRGALTLPQVQAGLSGDWYGFGKRLGVIKSD